MILCYGKTFSVPDRSPHESVRAKVNKVMSGGGKHTCPRPLKIPTLPWGGSREGGGGCKPQGASNYPKPTIRSVVVPKNKHFKVAVEMIVFRNNSSGVLSWYILNDFVAAQDFQVDLFFFFCGCRLFWLLFFGPEIFCCIRQE